MLAEIAAHCSLEKNAPKNSGALHWRLQYQRVINEGEKGGTDGIHRVR
jgi:hypothetical protein